MSVIKRENSDTNDNNASTTPEINKSSMEILSELFSTFDAEFPVIVKEEKKDKTEEGHKKSKKSKKKHKHKDKKHKKKSKKRKRSSSASSSSDSSEVDLAQILIKEEKDKADKRIKIEGTSISLEIPNRIAELKSKLKNIKDKLAVKEEANKDEIKYEEGEVSDLEASNTEYKAKEIKKESKHGIIKKEITKLKTEVKKETSSEKKEKIKYEDGEITDSEGSKKEYKSKEKKKESKSKKRSHSSRDRSPSKEKELRKDDLRHKVRKHSSSDSHRSRRHDRDRDSHNTEDLHKHRDRHKSSYRDKSYDTYESRSRHREEYKDDGFYRHRDKERSKDSDRVSKSDKWFMRERYRGYSRDRSRIRDNEESSSSSRIDKKKLLEIARRNAITMMKSGSVPGAQNLGSIAQEKMIAAIKSGGKTIEELTDFCKSLSKKEQLGELSSLSEKEDSDNDEPFHHPFLIKDRPTSITMNIKNSVPLPTKTTQERTTELRMQFPVSSGQQHRVNEEWVPVPTPKKPAAAAAVVPEPVPKPSVEVPSSAPLALPPPLPAEVPLPPPPLPKSFPDMSVVPLNTMPGPQVFPAVPDVPSMSSQVDISSIVSQRLTAMRKLQENPHDSQALTEIYRSNKEVQSWAQSKQNFGQFTGTTGAQILSQAELSSGYQAWAKKDQLQTAAPVSGGMGMHLLQKMGWKPGEGLGKEKTGTLEPLLLEVKLDKKGLVADEEQKGGKKKVKGQTMKTLQGKHPVSLLGEYASKRKLGAPQYLLEFECGPDHKKNFLFKVILNGVEYKPNVASANKKEAKANAATIALQQIGLLA
ncbi:protein SON isoform X1 [Sitophilus oryzae]|uniref:Protein SON isoform X1 n=1 Tax=Sitophilus oryzae TaxID=7048 RepID=A0A6J2YDP0_SITOR|nr:protein SON isoform X1 [Sitophilus oryzae]